MIHTFKISYGLSLTDATTCAWALNRRLPKPKLKEYITDFLDINKKLGHQVFKIPDLTGIQLITLVKYEDRNGFTVFRIYFLIEAEILRTGNDTLDLYICTPEHAKELQTQYAKAIYSLLPEAFTGRPALLLYNTDFAPEESYAEEEFQEHSGLYSLPYLALASIKRMDFTYDIVRSSPEDAKLFTYMVQQSYYDSRKKKVAKGKQKKPDSKDICYDKEFANDSRAFNVYYKYDKMMDKKYDTRPNIPQIREDSRNIVRIELPNFTVSRQKIKSYTHLQIPSDALTLGPLPYLVTEQVPFNVFVKEYGDHIGNGPDLKWYKRRELNERLDELVREGRISEHAKTMMKKISQAISQGRSRQFSHSLAKAITAFKENGEIILHKKRDKDTQEQILETFKCSMAQYNSHKKLAIANGMSLVTIPDSRPFKELSALTVLRNYEFGLLSSVIIANMLPYQSITETAPEMEPVKEVYDSILEFLYGLYDQYSADWNAKCEEIKRYSREEIGQ